MTAAIVDSVNYLARLFQNVNFTDPDKSALPRIARPYEAAIALVEPKTISLLDLGKLLEGGQP